RLFWSEIVFYVGFQMYIVALPFLMKAFTRNTLRESGGLDGLSPEEINALVRENRSLARIAHWAAQAVAYISIPLFTRSGKTAPTKLVLRAAIPRALILAGIPVIFFASGMVSASAALWILTGLIAAQSFVQGLHITFQSGGIARLLGHPDVLSSERLRANAIRTRWSAVIAILAPVLAGHIALIGNWMGKEGVGSAVIYGIYAGTVALSGLIYASIKLLSKPLPSDPNAKEDETGIPKTAGFGGALKNVFVSMKNGIKLVLGNRFLRVYVGLALLSALFADPLVFNVLPEFVETVLAANPGAVEGILAWFGDIPLVGGVLNSIAAWFFKGLTGTPMGFFAMLIASSSIGSLLATSLIKPARKLFSRLGFKTEEALAIPFYAIAALSVPAFWLMISTGSFWGLLGLYGLQTFLGSFAMILITGVFQKNLDGFKKKRYQILSATSFVSILAAIAATYLYGFVLSDIPIQTSLYIAAIATTILGGFQLAAPWLMFRKDQRKKKPPSRAKPVEEDEEQAPSHEHSPEKGHLPNENGPLSIGL
ncbi:MAG: hypothetical protein V3S11_00660, partial [Elusimicrobiota bacterium]